MASLQESVFEDKKPRSGGLFCQLVGGTPGPGRHKNPAPASLPDPRILATLASRGHQTYVFCRSFVPQASRHTVLPYFSVPSLPDLRILLYFCALSLRDLQIVAYSSAPSLEDTEKALKSTSGKPPGERVLKIGKCVLEPLFGRSRGGPQEGTKIQRLSASQTHVF